ncbi:MAG: methyltransferase domain-containing protein [bacterium]|jgi:ubiquinone/menaquinone biosynthesis C-methylase UbiE|nr:methyltransferase domain-containing protein [bacterium]
MAGVASLIHGSAEPAGRGITIGTPRVYGLYASYLFRGRRRAAFRTLLSESGARPGDHVLDVGSGTGYFARLLAGTVGARGSVEGIDASPEMVAYATRRARRRSNCRFLAGTAESLPYPDGRVDVAVSSFVIHHLTEEAQLPALREMGRVLRPGGTLLVAEVPTGDDMGHPAPPLDGALAEAGFTAIRSGEVGRWMRFAVGTS